MSERATSELLGLMSGATVELGRHVPPPEWVEVHGGHAYRHRPEHRDARLLCFLKSVKLCSTLHGAMALAINGLPQECYALCRVAEEMGEDIVFMIKPRGAYGGLSPLQQRFLDEFYQEEFDHPDPVQASQKRDRVPRRKILAAIMSEATGVLDRHTALETADTLHKTFSGFVHGAYEHIMDTCGEQPPRYFLAGMSGTPRIDEMWRVLPSYVYRGSMSVEAVARQFGRADIVEFLMQRSDAFARLCGLIAPDHQEALARQRADRPAAEVRLDAGTSPRLGDA